MSTINTGASLSSLSNFNTNRNAVAGSLERLSTGRSINRAADNPAGLVATGHFEARLASISSELTSIERTQSDINIQDATLGASLSNISDLGSMVVTALNAGGISSSELGAIQTQINGALAGIDHLGTSGGIDILSNVTAEMVVGTDPNTGADITQTVSLSDLPSVIETDPAAAQALVDGAREAVITRQAELGAQANEQEAMGRVLQEEQINIARANSQTRDTDFAKQSSALIRDQILSKASLSAMLVARQSDRSILSLLDINA